MQVYKASNVSTKNMEGAQEKRVIYDSLSFSSHSADGLSLDQPEVQLADDYESQTGSDSNRSMSAIAKAKAYIKVCFIYMYVYACSRTSK